MPIGVAMDNVSMIPEVLEQVCSLSVAHVLNYGSGIGFSVQGVYKGWCIGDDMGPARWCGHGHLSYDS
jgi:hypothetical protein